MPIYKMSGSKNGKQKYRVRINYMDAYGKNRQLDRVAYGASEAKELERLLEVEIKQKQPIKRITVRALSEEYTKSKGGSVRESTMNRDKGIMEKHIIPYLGDVLLDKLTVPVLQEWKDSINQKTDSKKNKEKLKIKTKKNIYAVLRAMLNYAVKVDYLSKNPLDKIDNFKDVTTIKREMQYYTPEEFTKFISAAREYAEKACTIAAWDFYVFFAIAFYTGLRKGEIHALKWSDIDGSYLSVKRSITQKLKGGDVETPPKNQSSIRTIQMPAPLIDILNKHKNRYAAIDRFTDDFRICGGTRPLRDTSIENANQKFAKLAGVKKIRIHDFRHSHASVLVNNGINIQEVARRLGHSNIEITWNTYSHLYPKEEERATEILNKIL